MSAIRGSCLCGGIKFEIAGPVFGADELPLLAMPQAARRGFPQPRRVAASDFRFLAGES